MLFVVQGKLYGQAVQHSLCMMGEQARRSAGMMLDVETACVQYFCMGLGCWLLAACSCDPAFLTLAHILRSALHATVDTGSFKRNFGIIFENNAYSLSCWELDLKIKTNLIHTHPIFLSFLPLLVFLTCFWRIVCSIVAPRPPQWVRDGPGDEEGKEYFNNFQTPLREEFLCLM